MFTKIYPIILMKKLKLFLARSVELLIVKFLYYFTKMFLQDMNIQNFKGDKTEFAKITAKLIKKFKIEQAYFSYYDLIMRPEQQFLLTIQIRLPKQFLV